MKYVSGLSSELSASKKQALLYTPYKPRWPEDIDPSYSMIDQIRQKDKLLFYPFDSVEPFIRLLNEAAERPDVISIKITIYRLASHTKLVEYLCAAAENGKDVTVLIELRARFDEQNIINWSDRLEEAGCNVTYGFDFFKVHSKIGLITLSGKNGLRYIIQVGTGNYNENTAQLYTDLSLITAKQPVVNAA